ncbi:hypothetical protein SAMN05421823_102669 [Catalinimonas alkaloidigena]|uniref:Short-chain dehydrogenase n=1 Tax=Catalinimonas alkaloidigena TaxID=1075417 RepID=A0A1G9BNQ2_9BACT|nr:SDR family oxidoreductase [Catalinimonas alkaloidigena]SDK41053.1 hypothetical protein SAMN05421823_102669 [Catalinimonas alkaloidigena]
MNTPSTVLITGATAGFGHEFAKLFAKEGYNLILVARSDDELKQVASSLEQLYQPGQVVCIAKDLAEAGSAQALYDDIRQHNLTVDVLINNAGFGEHGLFTETDLEKELKIIQLNIATLTHLTKLYLREMVARDAGKILQLASVASFMPFPKMAVYAATKAYVLSFTESLQNELKDTHVTLTALCPGASDTEFFERAGAEDTVIVQDTPLYDAEEVAQAGFDALMKGEKRVIPGGMNKVQAWMSNLLPDSLLAAVSNKMMEEKK